MVCEEELREEHAGQRGEELRRKSVEEARRSSDEGVADLKKMEIFVLRDWVPCGVRHVLGSLTPLPRELLLSLHHLSHGEELNECGG